MKKLVEKFLRKRMNFKDNVTFGSFIFKPEHAISGSGFRVCVTVHNPRQSPPYTEENWGFKICAFVIGNTKLFSFTAYNIATPTEDKEGEPHGSPI